jgi:hypothetical protein
VINTAKLMCETLKMRWDPLVPFYGRLGALSFNPIAQGEQEALQGHTFTKVTGKGGPETKIESVHTQKDTTLDSCCSSRVEITRDL